MSAFTATARTDELRKLDRPESEQRRHAQHVERASEHVRFDGWTHAPAKSTFPRPAPRTPLSSVPVSLLVSTLPLIQVPTTGPTFTYQIGGATPAPQSVQITSSTSGLNIAASAAPNNGGPNFLRNNSCHRHHSSIVDAYRQSHCSADSWSRNIHRDSNSDRVGSGNSPQTFVVTLTVSSNPTLIRSVQSLNFNYQVGQTAPSNQTIISPAAARR